MSRRPVGWTTTGSVALLAVIAGTVSYLHMHQLVAEHGRPGWVAALTPLSVDGMIVAASTAFAGGLGVGWAGWAAAVGAAGDRQRGKPGGERGGGRANRHRAGHLAWLAPGTLPAPRA